MSLPPGFLEELRSRVSLARVAGRKVTWDRRKSNQGRGDMWAPCPFHQEKTASFHVDDRQGFYYCFGCHAKGDAISFVRESENVGFLEAVEILAREAGMAMPARDPQARERADRRAQLAEVMEAAVQHYRLQLKTAAGARARAYLAGRGLDAAALERWEIGFAPASRQGLWEKLRERGIGEELIIAAGLAARPEDGGPPYDRFRERIIFPIRDGRGRAVALGGRAMSPEVRAKYLNSPETELFDKGRILFNLQRARAAAGKGEPLIVAEGYMDVIALSEAGFAASVAPLGTAITEHQLQMLWRVHPEPIVALDGDAAGLRAAMRLMDLALPLLEAGRSLRFALLPEGQDPDDLIRAGGPAAMQACLDSALPLVRLLWQRETEGRVFDSPERRSALDKALRRAIGRIRDRSLRAHYGQAIGELRAELFSSGRLRGRHGARGARGAGRGRRGAAGGFPPAPVGPLETTRRSLLAAAGGSPERYLRQAVILATLIANPQIVEDFVGALENLDLPPGDFRAIRDALLRHADAGAALGEKLGADLGPGPLEKLFGLGHLRVVPVIRSPGDHEAARLCVAQELAKLAALQGGAREVVEAAEDLETAADEGVTWRLGQVARAREQAFRSRVEAQGEYDRAANGAVVSREERDAFRRLVEEITPERGKGGGRGSRG